MKKSGRRLRSDVWQSFSKLTRGKKAKNNVALVYVCFNKEAYRKTLVKMIIKDELPFKFVEAEGFLEFMATFCPKFDVLSRRIITRDSLQLYENEKKMLKNMFTANCQRV